MDVTPLVYLIAALVALGFVLALFLPGEARPASPLITQPYAPGQTWEQPTPYFAAPVPESPDPLEVAANLDRKAMLATTLLFGTLVMLGAYFVAGPQLRAEAAVKQLEKSAERGSELYASLCFDCHGKRGQGLIGFTLNKPDFRATCGPNGEAVREAEGKACKPSDDEKVRDFLTKTISRGRPFPPPRYSMPAWSRDENGPLNPEQVNQVVSFVMHGDWERPLQIREQQGLALEETPPSPPKAPSPEEGGRIVAQTYCVACHSFEQGKTSPNPLAPNLSKYGAEGPFNDPLKALKTSGDQDWLKKWVQDATVIKPGTAMPPWKNQLSEQQINDVVAYLLSLK